jgi:hypothetical protein
MKAITIRIAIMGNLKKQGFIITSEFLDQFEKLVRAQSPAAHFRPLPLVTKRPLGM